MVKFKYISLFLISLFVIACSDEYEVDNPGTDSTSAPVEIALSTKGLALTDTNINKQSFRILAFNSIGKLEFNKVENQLESPSQDLLRFQLRPGKYFIYAFMNETESMNTLLENTNTIEDINQIKISVPSNIDQKDLPLVWSKMIYVRAVDPIAEIGQVSLNNSDWLDNLPIQLERVNAKIDISARGQKEYENIIIQKLTLENQSVFSNIEPTVYPDADPLKTLDYPDLNMAVTNEVGNYTLLLENQILHEYIQGAGIRNATLKMELIRHGINETHIIQLGDISRGKHYKYEVSIKPNSVVVDNIEVLPWQLNVVDENISNTEITFSTIEVPYSYNVPSKVHFTTRNIPEDKIYLLTNLTNDPLNHISTKFDTGVTKIDYNYDPVSKSGSGFLTIKRSVVSATEDELSINAAGITRVIKVSGLSIAGSNIYWNSALQALAFDDEPARNAFAPNEKLQGVFFKYGALAALPGINNQIGTIWSATGKKYTNYLDSLSGLTSAEHIAPVMAFNPSDDKGDICIFMTRRGQAPGFAKHKKWRLPNRDEIASLSGKVVYEGSNIAIQGSYTGEKELTTGLRVAGKNFFPSSGLANITSVYQVRAYYRYMINSPAFNGENMYTFQGSNANMLLREDVNRTANFTSVRCVADDSPTPIIPLHKLNYDCSELVSSGALNGAIPSELEKNVYIDNGKNVKLSNIELTLNTGLHIGWIIDNTVYSLGDVVTNVTKDMDVKPYIENI